MTIGIYLLRFNNTNKVYVGQSLRIEERFTKHKYRIINGLANIKLNTAYELYGLPILEILLECKETELDALENEAIDIFNSVNNGFNINTKAGGGGAGLQGELHSNSKYTETSIIEVFKSILVTTNFKIIAEKHDVSIHLVRDISKGKAHRWLSSRFPDEYSTMLNTIGIKEKNTAKDQNLNYPPVVSPTGDIFTIDNLSAFARKYNLNKSHLCGLLNGKRKSHLGWTTLT